MELDDVQVIPDEKGRVVRTSKYHPNKSREVLILDDSDDDQMKAEKPKRTREEKPILKTSNNPLKQCPLCPNHFNNEQECQLHFSEAHFEDRPFVCTYEGCEKTFKKREKMKRHIDCVHHKLKPHACQLCELAFSRKDKLKRHISNIHFHEKPFSCHHCDHRTSRKERMRQHLLTVHAKTADEFSVLKSDLADMALIKTEYQPGS